jgi:signal transduction histidine kinase
LRNAAGSIIGASKIARDVSALRAAEAERLRLVEENATITEALNNVGAVVASDLDRDKVVQAVTDAATELTAAEFGAFFYNLVNDTGESYTLYTISGVPREAFANFPMPRNTEVFGPTFKGTAVVRSADISRDPRYGKNPPYHGMPRGHLPVRSYLAVPVKGRRGDVIGGLFFGHSEIGRFTEQHERLAIGVASWASVALENARMFSMVREANRLKDEFLASLSHELRTPLNAVLGYAHMLQKGAIPMTELAKALDVIGRNADSLTRLVNDVLDTSRIVTGKIRLNLENCDVSRTTEDALGGVMPACRSKSIRVTSHIESGLMVYGDPDRLLQVLWNLLSNAVKFTAEGGAVTVSAVRSGRDVRISVEDTGIGIAPESLPYVTRRFWQGDPTHTRTHGGLGLGLALAQDFVELHGGHIAASSEGIGHGSRFDVLLPAVSVEVPAG